MAADGLRRRAGQRDVDGVGLQAVFELGALKLLGLTKRVSDLLSITKLLTVFDSYDTEREAVASFRPVNV